MASKASVVVSRIRYDYSSTSVTTSGWVELVASLPGNISEVEIFDSSGQVLELAVGAAGDESEVLQIVPGGNGRMPAIINEGVRLSVQAVDGDATAGQLVMNLWG